MGGGVVLQIVKPGPGAASWQEQLDANGDVSGTQKADLMDAMAQIGMRIEMMELIPGWTPGEKAREKAGGHEGDSALVAEARLAA